jgi:multiple sugar transport system substrate-binding protein
MDHGLITRRDLLTRTATAAAVATLLPSCESSSVPEPSKRGPTTVVFSHGVDPSGAVAALIEQFNAANQGRIKVLWRQESESSTTYHARLKREFEAGEAKSDVISGDVTWPAEFGNNEWVEDLTELFDEEMRRDFLGGPLQAVTLNDRFYAVPWYTDLGMLYYRVDLLAKSGFKSPPVTWAELETMAAKVRADSDVRYGLVFQGARYEGGVCNGLEFIWGAGGEVLDPEDVSQVVADSPEAARGLQTERETVTQGSAPGAVVRFQEHECDTAWLSGDALFMRLWPYAYSQLQLPGSAVKPAQAGLAPLPVSPGGTKGYSCLGGWNLFINRFSDKKEQAWEFIKFLSGDDATKVRALKGSYLPPLKSLYEDREVLDKVAVVRLARDLVDQIKARPASPFYAKMSLEMQREFHASLTGRETPTGAVMELQESVGAIVSSGG